MIKHSSGFASLAAMFVFAAAQAGPPEHIKITYELSVKGMSGDAVETLEHNGKTYSIVSETRGRGILATVGVLNKRTSRGHITPQGLRPDEYRDERPFGWVASAKFDWEARTITQERKGKSETLPMPATAQDPLSLAYTFAFVPPKEKEYDIIRADGRGLTPFRFAVVGNERIPTPLGELQTLHIAKVRDGPDDKATDIWFATERDFIPVRVLVVDKDGARADQIVTRIDN
ncbi:MAG TPA: DUF3108 domain-containing protein [Burkholderiales bacterium]|nr:DUF3108 domain-containing protein [Burkholderiales bacterium]